MKILICCENFYPSIGGVQEVVYQIASRLIEYNHKVTIATSNIMDRKFDTYKRIKLKEFKIHGNYITGIKGEKNKYQDYILQSNFDYIFIYAAQQWTFDLVLDILDEIKTKIIFVPCGFSALNIFFYKKYFLKIRKEINKFNHIIFHTKKYQDFYFLKEKLHKNKYSIIPNGANLKEFNNLKTKKFYKNKFNLDNDFVILSNSSLSYDKGQLSISKIMNKIKTEKKITLFINANISKYKTKNLFIFIISLIKIIARFILFREIKYSPILIFIILKFKAFISIFSKKFTFKLVDLPRSDLVNLYKASDLFIFPSRVEYCPLVIYESMAAGTAFISSNVGNVESIVDEYKCGLICKSIKKHGLSNIDHDDFVSKINFLISNEKIRNKLAYLGRNAFLNKFHWDQIFIEYKKLFR